MFTVKVRLEKGDENIFEAQRVEYIEKEINTGNNIIYPGVLIHYEGGGNSHYGLSKSGEPVTRIWVMNRYGATIANYLI